MEEEIDIPDDNEFAENAYDRPNPQNDQPQNIINEPKQEKIEDVIMDYIGEDNPNLKENPFLQINVKEALSGSGSNDALLYKGKKKIKEKKSRTRIELIGKKRAKPEKSMEQKILDKISKIKGDYNEVDVMSVAKESGLQIPRNKAKLLFNLSTARTFVHKVGIPSELCKKKFKFYINAILFKRIQGLTDDKNVWDTFIGYQFNVNSEIKGKPYEKLLSYSLKINKFSFVTDELFETKNIVSGYCQDRDPDSCIVYNPTVTPDSEKLKTALKKENSDNIIAGKVNEDDISYVFNSKNYIICYDSKEKVDDIVKLIVDKKPTCITSKNKMSVGIKALKERETASYINIHDMQVTDFTPSFIFFPVLTKYRCYIECEIDTNSFYENFPRKVKSINEVVLPPNCVNLNNLGSFIELLALVRLCESDISNELAAQIDDIFDVYHKNKNIFNAWGRIYKDFENIILSFYDMCSSRISYDGMRKLRDKINDFMSNYNIMKSPLNEYDDVIKLVSYLQKTMEMTRIFMTTAAPINAVDAIRRIVLIVTEGKIVKNMNIDTLFRTAGIVCLECMANGSWAMIPAIRSKSAFLGSVSAGGNINKENLIQQMIELYNIFNEKFNVKKAKKDEVQNVIKMIDDIIEYVILNTGRKFMGGVFRDQLDLVKSLLMKNPTAYNSMREDVTSWIFSPGFDENTAKAELTFLNDPNVVALLTAVYNVLNVMSTKFNLNGVYFKDVVNSFDINKGVKAIPLSYEDSIKHKNDVLKPDIYKDVVIKINGRNLLESIPNAKNLNENEKTQLLNKLEKYDPIKNEVVE